MDVTKSTEQGRQTIAPPKPFWQTSQFFFTVAVLIGLGYLVAKGFITIEQAIEVANALGVIGGSTITSVAILGISAVVREYIKGRNKVTEIKATAQAEAQKQEVK